MFPLLFIISSLISGDTTRSFHLSGHAQGTTWHITYQSPDSTILVNQIDSILDKIDSSLSLYKPYSLVWQFNKSDKQIRMDDHLKAVIQSSLDTWRLTNGDFDVTVQPLVEAWGFSAHHPDQYPDSARIRQLLTCVGSGRLSIKGDYLVKSTPCVCIDPDGIAQGYSVDVLADFLDLHGINNYIVELGGELRIKGRKRIGIEAPNEDAFLQPVMQKILYVDSGAITTSGSYRAFHEHNGKKFSHTIDPHSGYPADNEIISVTVYAKTAMKADAYDNVFVMMGLQKAVEYINNRSDLAAFFIYRNKEGAVSTFSTKSFNALLQP